MSKSLFQILKEIDAEKYYQPSVIAKKDWLVGYEGTNPYYAILELIKLGRLEAKDFSRGKTPYYKVLGKDLIKYLKTFE